jgi:hypothetical protein
MAAALAARDLLVRLGFPATLRLGTAAGAAPSLPRAGLRLDALDDALGGGLPRGRLSEIVGPSSCGKTALLHRLLAAAGTRGEVVALVDLADAFSPPAAAAIGVDLARTLWVRPRSVPDALRCTELLLDAGGFGVVAIDLGATTYDTRLRLGTGTWPRLARAAERSSAAVAVLAGARVAGAATALGLALRPLTRHWSRRGRGGPTLFDGFDTEVALVRNRLGIAERTATIRISAA